MFPDVAALGANAATWKAEYDRVKAFGLTATLMVNTSMEGGAGGAIRNFPQKVLLSALHARPGALDADYLDLITTPAPNIAQPAGSVIRLGV